MKVFFEESFIKDIGKIEDKKLLKKIKAIIDEIKIADDTKGIHNLEKLKGYKTYYRIRVREYRIGIEIISNRFYFTRFLHRKEIYKYFP